MADWRSGGSGGEKPGKPPRPAKPEPQAKPASSPPQQPAAGKAGGDWRGKAGSSATPAGTATGSTRSWTGAGPDAGPASGSTLARYAMIVVLFCVVTAAIGGFLWWLFARPGKAPLHVISVGRYDDPELVESPFGDSDRATLRGVNQANIEVFPREKTDNDNYLARLLAEGLIGSGGGGLKGGGPTSRIVTVYVNALALERENRLYLLPQSADVARMEPGAAASGAELKAVLAAVADSLRRSTTAWVVLDLHAAQEIFGHREIAWRDRLEEALQALEPEQRKRLVITLACDNGEQNWSSSELGTSFFGHFFRLGMAGEFVQRGKVVKVSTLAELRKTMDSEVVAAVAGRRFASQHPVWLAPEGFDWNLSVVGATRAEDVQPTPVPGIAARQGQLDQAWEQLLANRPQAWRWDPAAYAVAEARLVQLEQLALFASNGAFESALNEALSAIARIAGPIEAGQISWIEREQHQRFALPRRNWSHDYDALDELVARAEPPSFLQPPPATPDPAAPPGPDATVSANDRPVYVWKWLVRAAATGDRQSRAAVFRADVLGRAFQYAGTGPDSLEQNLLRLLLREVEWTAADESGAREESVASAILLFQQLQGLGTRPVPELAAWLEPALAPVESRFLRALDWLLAGSFDEAAREFQATRGLLQGLAAETVGPEAAMLARDAALRELPLQILHELRLYQFANESETAAIRGRLQKYSQLAVLNGVLQEQLAQPPIWPPAGLVSETGTKLEQGLQEARTLYREWVDEQCRVDRNAKLNPQTFRNLTIALANPLTPLQARGTLHTIAARFLGESVADWELGDRSNIAQPPQRSAAPALEEFLAGLPTAGDRDRWSRLLDGRTQEQIRTVFAEEVGQVAALEAAPAGGARNQLAAADSKSRWLLPALAGALSTQRELQLPAWPWSASQQRWRWEAAQYRLWQTRRLAQAGWGDNDLAVVTSPEQMLFWRLAESCRPESLLAGAAPIDALIPRFREDWSAPLRQTATLLGSLRPRFGKPGEEVDQGQERQRTGLEIGGEQWSAVSEVGIENQGKRMELREESGTVRTGLPMDLSVAERRYSGLSVDLKPWKEAAAGGRYPESVLRVRGNWTRSPVDWRLAVRERIQYQVQFEQQPQTAATVRVLPPTSPPVINVVLLLDCSDSMNIDVDRPFAEQDGAPVTGKVKLLELVKDQAGRLLEGLERVQLDRQADVNLCLMPFGLKKAPQGVTPFDPVRPQIFRSKLGPLTPEWKDGLEACIRKLEPEGATPLYDAMREACQLLQKQPGTSRLVFVLSDGVNDTRGEDGLSGTARNVMESVGECRVSVFHFDYFDQWIERALQQALEDPVKKKEIEEYYRIFPEQLPEYFQTQRNLELKLKEAGVGELIELGRSGDQFVYHRYEPSDFNAMVNDLEAAIPRLKVRVSGSNGFASEDPDQREFVITEGLPCDVTVTAEGPFFGSASRTLRVVGGETVRLTFDINGPQLRMPSFRDDHPEFEPAGSAPDRNARSGQLYLNPVGEQGGRWKYQFGFGESPATGDVFIQRPAFLVTELIEPDVGPKSGRRILLSDTGFLPGRHFPIAETASVQLQTQRHRVRMWHAATVPECVRRVPAWSERNDEEIAQDLQNALNELGCGDQELRLARAGNQWTVTLQRREAGGAGRPGGLFVICPSAVRSDRTYDLTRSEETHVFTLQPAADGSGAELWLTTVERLDAALDGNLQRYDSGPGG